MKHIIVFMSLFMIACNTEPIRQFNTEDVDKDRCYNFNDSGKAYIRCWRDR
jgi:hypothetical protein